MYEREETTTTTEADGTSHHHQITERTRSGIGDVLWFPIGLTLCGCVCWLVIRITQRIDQALTPAEPPLPAYVVREK